MKCPHCGGEVEPVLIASGEDFEKYLCDQINTLSCATCEMTKATGDQGVDLIGSTPILVEMAKWVWGCEIEFPGYEVDHRGVSLEGVVAPCLPFSCLNHSVDSFTYRVRQALPEVREDFRLVA